MSDVTANESDATAEKGSEVEVETKDEKPVETAPVEVDDPIALKAEIKKWTKFSRDHEDNVKKLVSEKEAWNKTRATLEAKLSETSTALEEKTAELTRIATEGLKVKTAAEYKLPENALKFLTASDEAGLKQQAEELSGMPAFKAKPLQLNTQGRAGANAAASDPVEALKQWSAKNLKK
jgi:hypothetical protein